MTEQAATLPVPATANARRGIGVVIPRLIAGLVILLVWEGVVRLFAPPYVAKPSGIVAVFPKVIVDPAFLHATGVTLLAVAEGLAMATVLGTLIGLLIGRSVVADRVLRHY